VDSYVTAKLRAPPATTTNHLMSWGNTMEV